MIEICEFKSIAKYKYMKQFSLKYNTSIPSSTPVERLFSFAELILCPRRSSLMMKILNDALCYMRLAMLKKKKNKFNLKVSGILVILILSLHNLFSLLENILNKYYL